MEAEAASAVFKLMDLPVRFPEQCFPSDGVYVDHSENGGGMSPGKVPDNSFRHIFNPAVASMFNHEVGT